MSSLYPEHRENGNKMERWLQRHSSQLLFICIIILFALIIALVVTIFTIYATPTGTEANLYYNGFDRII